MTRLLALGLAAPAQADERPDHYKGESSATLEQALANLSSHNTQLAAILAKDELGPEDTAKIHELTYTLENALEQFEGTVVAVDGVTGAQTLVHGPRRPPDLG